MHIVNLDPANTFLPYECTVSISELIKLEDVMDNLDLGPNGGMIYCMEYLEKNIAWLVAKLESTIKASTEGAAYFLFDLPGQVELFTHHTCLNSILGTLQKDLDIRFCAIHLVDSYHCADPAKFISIVFLSLATMLRLELPHINVLSKIDLVESRGALQFNLDFYTNSTDLGYLLPLIPRSLQDLPSLEEESMRQNGKERMVEMNPFEIRYQKLNQALCGLVEDYSLVSFQPLNIEDKESVYSLIRRIDKTNGFVQSQGIDSEQWHNYTLNPE